MDWRDFMRGFFGGQRPPPQSQYGNDNRPNHRLYPPPPPASIREFCENEGEGESSSPRPPLHDERHGHEKGQGQNQNRPIDDFQSFPGREFGENSFVFGNMFSIMGEMFQEMEKNMRDMEGFFENFKMDGTMIPQLPPALPPPGEVPSSGKKSGRNADDNVRDFFLKEPDSQNRGDERHYVAEPHNADEKVDRNLDELYSKSLLDLSEIPVPSNALSPSGPPQSQESRIFPFGFGSGRDGPGTIHKSFQRTYQTYSFKNGRWEGEIVKEDDTGKTVTRYYQDEHGQKQEHTEFFPSHSSNGTNQLTDGNQNQSISIREIDPFSGRQQDHNISRIFEFFDRIFKPRM